MSTERQVAVRDLVEEAKKRIVFLVICVVGLSYLMSLTSSSVLVNLPAAASMIFVLRYLSVDFDMRRKAAAYKSKQSSAQGLSDKKLPEVSKVSSKKYDWRKKVDSPVVEDAIDQFSRHLVTEWVTGLWYSRLTPDKEGPEELVQIINGVLGELSHRARNMNLIDLLTRDIINLICTHLELFRATQAKIERQQLESLTIDQRDIELKLILAVDNKLHPALVSAEAEHKVLQHLMDGLISFTFCPEDLKCSFFRYTVRELLACAVMRPVLNLASPRFINERIESLVLSTSKASKGARREQEADDSKADISKLSSDDFSRCLDPSVTGVELVQLKNNQSQAVADDGNEKHHLKDPLLSIDARSTCSWGSLPSESKIGEGIQRHRLGGEWGDMLDLMSQRKTQALAPEHFENMWAKGRNYKKKNIVEPVGQSSAPDLANTVDGSKFFQHEEKKSTKPDNGSGLSGCDNGLKGSNMTDCNDHNISNSSSMLLFTENDEHDHISLAEVESGSSSPYTSEEDETSAVTGLDSPGTKVWDGKKNRNVSVSRIRHPLESSDGHRAKKSGKGRLHHHKLPRTQSARKRSRLNSQELPVWQEVERTRVSSGDGQDILNSLKQHRLAEDSSDDDIERLGRVDSGAASSSASSISLPQNYGLSVKSIQNSSLADSFFMLRCEVLGANIVKGGSRMFAVYCISVTDVNNNTWSIKRRFRHFEELHRRLKEFPQYNLHLPPKHFLSTGLDVFVIQERCKLLDIYLKNLLQLPTVSASIEVWDFLSVDSQTYLFSSSISIIDTLSVDLDGKPPEKAESVPHFDGPATSTMSSTRGLGSKDSSIQVKCNTKGDGSRFDLKGVAHKVTEKPSKECAEKLSKECKRKFYDSSSDLDNMIQKTVPPRNLEKSASEGDTEGAQGMLLDASSDPSFPSEWVPPNLSVPILDMVDVILQLQDGGWIRRKVFWVAKQVLQLGMGDAFDDWLIEKIQLLRRGSVIASGIRRVEQILWPDGIFITKHPKRRQPPPSMNVSQSTSGVQELKHISSPGKGSFQKHPGENNFTTLDDLQKREADQRAKFVYDLMIENAPAAIAGLIGRKEYEQCAKDLYFFLQSSIFIKQLAFDLLELLLLSAFPELDYVVAHLYENRQKHGES